MDTDQRTSSPLVSLIIPVYNEEDSVTACTDAVSTTLANNGIRFELIFVNDGSNDRTLTTLLALSADDNRIRILNLSRNFGKEAALTAGIDSAHGDLLVPMDVDLQDPPELIPQMLAKWREGYDVVYALRVARPADTVAKRASAGWFYRLFNRIANINIPENAGDFRLMDRRVAEALKQLPERNRFMKGLFSWVGFRSIGIPYERPRRTVGTSKWNYWKLWNFALDGLVGFSTAPLRLWTYAGFLIALASFMYATFIIARVLFTGIDLPGYASLMTVVLFMGGVQLISIGVIGEYLGRLFTEVKARPIYITEGFYRLGVRETTAKGE